MAIWGCTCHTYERQETSTRQDHQRLQGYCLCQKNSDGEGMDTRAIMMVMERMVDMKKKKECWRVSKSRWGKVEARPRPRVSATRGGISESNAEMQPRSHQPRRTDGGGCESMRKDDEEEWSLGQEEWRLGYCCYCWHCAVYGGGDGFGSGGCGCRTRKSSTDAESRDCHCCYVHCY